ncbi:TRAP transporter permease [Vannielia litorea]|uniref:TRAP transporter permease n=1 Tax=Vannielia litorea TaxID=1217970 RepID=UPI001BCBA236|nr:TRAP transporter fused permease subunit [Vannielia litorea]
MCASIVALGAVYALDIARLAGYAFFKEQYLALFFGLTMAVGFLHRSGRLSEVPERTVPFWDYGAAAASFVCGAYPALNWNWILMMSFQRPIELIVLGTIALVLLFEGIRRYAGWTLIVVGAVFLSYAFLAPYMPGVFYAQATSYSRLVVYLYSDVNALFGIPIAIVIGVVLAFVLFGQILFTTGGGDFFTDVSRSLIRRSAGGPAKVAVLASSLFGSISGSAVANVVSTGSVTIPLMKKSGYTSVQAGAIEAAASSGGQLMPPIMGATAFLLAEFLGIPYAQVALAALVPICLYYLCLLLQVHLIARRDGIGTTEYNGKPTAQILKENGIYAIPLVVIVYAMFGLNFQPQKAAFLGIATIFAVHALKTRSLNFRIRDTVDTAGAAIVEIALICAFAGIIIGVLNITGLAFSLSLLLTQVGQSSLLLLLILGAGMSILMGMGMPTTGVYLLLAVLIGPALINLGVEPLGAHLFILYFGVSSQITPPICFAAIAAASIAGASGMATGWTAARLAATAYVVPFLFVYFPGLILAADWWTNLVTIVLAACGVSGLAVVATGYGLGTMRWPSRLLLGAAVGFLFLNLMPSSVGGLAVVIVALVVGLAALSINRASSARAATPAGQ